MLPYCNHCYRRILHSMQISPTTRHILIFLLIILPFLYFLFGEYMNQDFWFDETYTLVHFVFKDLKTIVQDYHVPNNHILHNLLNHLYLRAIGIVDVAELMDRPYRIRLLMFAYSLITIIYAYRTGKRFFNEGIAVITVAVLVTTIPFYNFTVQVRGYGMSIMLLTILLFYLLQYEADGRIRNALLVALLGALAIYAIPSNIYFLMSIAVVYAISAIRSELGFKREPSGTGKQPGRPADGKLQIQPDTKKNLSVIAMIAGSAGAAVVLYTPVFGEVIDNPWVRSDGLFNIHILREVLPQTYIWFISKRYLILLVIAVGLAGFLNRRSKGETFGYERHYVIFAALLVLPFVFSFIRGGNPFYRVFITLTPVFALFVALSFFYCMRFLKATKTVAWAAAVIAAVIYCQITFIYAISEKNRHLLADIEDGRISHNIYYNYFQGPYKPLQRTVQLTHFLQLENGPVFTYHVESSLFSYLRKFRIAYDEIEFPIEAGQTDEGRPMYVLAAHPRQFVDNMTAQHPEIECRRLHDDLSFHNVIRCRSRSQTKSSIP